MKKAILVSLFLIVRFLFSQEMPVINEVMPNLQGVSAGRRWLEIHNPGIYPFSLNGWQIQTAGTSFNTDFTFPDIIISPGQYIIIGESQVPFADYTTTLNLQAGMNNTVGVRLVSSNGNYKDTVLWSSPNNNDLSDDVYDPAVEFVVRPTQGHSLARKPNGYDSNNISDWSVAVHPTPGAANFIYFDISISELYISENEEKQIIHIVIHDLSTDVVDNNMLVLIVYLNDINIFNTTPNLLYVNKIAIYDLEANFVDNSMNHIYAEVSYAHDIDLTNNSKHFSFWHGFVPIIINELQFQPVTAEPEWIEFFNRSDKTLTIDNAFILNAAGRVSFFSATIDPFDYFIITQDKEMFDDIHPFVDMEKVYQPSSWATLANTRDTIQLFFDEHVKMDSLSYIGVSNMRGRSLERMNPWLDESIIWDYNMTEIASSPLAKNSNTPADIAANIVLVEMYEQGNSLEHRIHITNTGLTDYFEAGLHVLYKDETMEDFVTLAEMFIFIEDNLVEYVHTITPENRGYHYFLYKLLFGNETNTYHRSWLVQNPPVVVNEIMFQPNTGEPIWIEFIKLRDFLPASGLKFFARTDSIHIPFWEGDFALLTTNLGSALSLRESFNIPEDIPIFTGLRTLLNAGQALTLKDYDNNVYEDFAYSSNFSLKRGFSAERISPMLPPDAQNWTSSLVGATPGQKNSVFMNMIPSSSNFVIENNPFSPYRGEHCIITLQIEEQMVRADVKVFDIKGREVVKLGDKLTLPGEYSFVWNGLDSNNRLVSPGIYVVYVNIENMSGNRVMQKRKLIYVGY